MDDAGLNLGEGKDAGDRFGKSVEPIDHGDQNISHTSIFDLGHHAEPELRSLGLFDPNPPECLCSRRAGLLKPDTPLCS